MITSLTLIIGPGEFAHCVFLVLSKQTFRTPYHHVELAFLLKKTQCACSAAAGTELLDYMAESNLMWGEKSSSPDILSARVCLWLFI